MIVSMFLAQAFGCSAVPIAVLKFQLHTRKQLILANAVVALLVTIQFALLGAWTGAAMSGATSVASLFAAALGPRMKPFQRILIGVFFITIVFSVIPNTMHSVRAWLPLLAFANGRVAECSLSQRRVRLALLPSHALWLLYGALTTAWGTVVLEIFTATSNAIWLVRTRKTS